VQCVEYLRGLANYGFQTVEAGKVRSLAGKSTRVLVLVAITVFLLGALPNLVAAGRLNELQQKLRTYLSSRQSARQQLHGVKAEEQEARGELTAAQRALEQAESKLRGVQQKLEQTKSRIAQTERELAETAARLQEHRTQMQQYLLALYRSGRPTYLEVVFRATSFADFVNRAEFTRRIAQRDEELLTALVSEKQTFEHQKQELEQHKAQQAALKVQLQQQRDEVAARKAEAERVVNGIRQDRALAEQQFALMQQEYERIARQVAELQRRGGGYSGAWSGQLLRPVTGGVVTSRFGYRIHPILKKRKKHCGIDIAGLPVGTPIKAADDGLIIFAGWSDTAGKMVRIDHGSGIVTLYAHLSRCAVSKGQRVNRGEIIGYLGGTGDWCTGPHLHFGVCQSGTWVNPEIFVRF